MSRDNILEAGIRALTIEFPYGYQKAQRILWVLLHVLVVYRQLLYITMGLTYIPILPYEWLNFPVGIWAMPFSHFNWVLWMGLFAGSIYLMINTYRHRKMDDDTNRYSISYAPLFYVSVFVYAYLGLFATY